MFLSHCVVVGADIQEVIGSAIAFRLLFHFPLWLGCALTVADTFLILFLNVLGLKNLDAFFAGLIGIMCVCFFWDVAYVEPSAIEVAKV